MKNLEVQELNTNEAINIDGGCFRYCAGGDLLKDLANNIGDAWDSFWAGFSVGKR